MFSSIKRVSRATRSFTLGECSKSMSMHSGSLLLRHIPGDVGDALRAASLLEGVLARGVAEQRAGEHAVQDRGDPEHVEDEVELPIRNFPAAGAPAIRGDVFGL